MRLPSSMAAKRPPRSTQARMAAQRAEHQTQLAVQLERQSTPNSLDRAALVGISQGDFYRDVRQSTDDARAAYESVIDYFPNSPWAAIAQTRIGQLQMN